MSDSIAAQNPDRQGRLEQVLADYLQSIENGHPLDRAALIAAHPNLADALQSFFRNRDSMDRLAEPLKEMAEAPTITGPSDGTTATAVGNTVRYFGDYELLDEIARGGMGVVYKARQVNLNRIVALKMILAGQLANDRDVKRFYAEAEAAAKLDHSGIVPIFEIGQHDGQHYFSMAFIEGESLAKKVANGPLLPREAAEMVKKVAVAVEYAHEKGIIHRDLKPANVLLDGQGQPKVTDFGLAKQMQADSGLTGTGQILGTPSYMPPEQAAGKVDEVGPAADVYGLGAILYCLLTGRPPFQAANPMDTLLQVLDQEPVAPRQLNPQVPIDLETIALKCLDKSSSRRYASAKALADELTRYLEGRPILARRVSRLERFRRWCQREPIVASLSAAVVVALITGTIISSYYAVVAANRAEEKVALAESENEAKNEAQKQTKVAHEHLQQSVLTAVDAVQNSRGAAVIPMLSILEALPREMVIKELKSSYAIAEPHRKLGLAYGLAKFGEVDANYLCSQIRRAAPEEADNFVAALGHDLDGSLKAIRALVQLTESEQDWRLKARLAIIALHLGDEQIAADMCRVDDRPDPVQRTIFIDEFPVWHGELAKLAARCAKNLEPPLCSALCLGVGSVPPNLLTSADMESWKLVADWFQTAPDAATHSASGWALRQWKVDLPAVKTSRQPEAGRRWFVNSLGMTMLRIQPGRFVRLDDSFAVNAKEQTVRLTRAFFLCDAEVSIGQFWDFVSDAKCADEDKPAYRARFPNGGDTFDVRGRPQTIVNWYDALLFCNWLSRKEGLLPCYERTGQKETVRGMNNQETQQDEWHLAANGTGYRLPTEAEWEYACCAGTTTNFASGNDIEFVRKYATFQASSPAGCETKLPNGWGLFDMHGNVREWCYDRLGSYDAAEASDPMGGAKLPSQMAAMRILRGGSWSNVVSFCRSGSRGAEAQDNMMPFNGFRVALGSLQPDR